MQELIKDLYVNSTIDTVMVYVFLAVFLFAMAHMVVYLNVNRYEEHNTIFFLKMTFPLLLIIILGPVYAVYSYQKTSNALDANNKNNYSIVRKENVVHFISKNENLRSADLKVKSEDNENVYLEYKDSIFEVKKDQLQ